MGYPKWIDAHGGIKVCVENAADEEAFTNPPNKHVEVEDAAPVEAAAPEPEDTSETPTPHKKGAKKK
jgi:hypothetical protein